MNSPWDAPDPLIGRTFDGRYAVLSRIGHGGMGTVYRATQLSVGRDVALKVLAPDLAENPEMVGRFMREAQVASRLRHPNTIVIHDFGHSSDGLFIAMELLEGETLHERMKREKPMELLGALRIVRAIAGSLAEAHSAHVVHRDIKPDNIFLHKVGDLEVVKVLDFGIAKFFQLGEATAAYEDAYETSVGLDGRRPIIGTWHYMAPEQIESKNVDHRVDLYALGIAVYEMVSGYKPFQGDSMAAMLRMHLLEPPMPMPETTPNELAILVHRLLEKDPARRPQTADEVGAAVDRIEKAVRSGTAVPRGPGLGATTGFARREEPQEGAPEPTGDAGPAAAIASHLRRAGRFSKDRLIAFWDDHGGTVQAVIAGLVVAAALVAGAMWFREHRRQKALQRDADPAPVAAAILAQEAPPVPDPAVPPAAVPEPVAAPNLPSETDPRAWVRVEAGAFDMGTADDVPVRTADEGPVHRVEITRALMVRATEVTQAEWQALMGNAPAAHTGCTDCPVDSVNWFEAAAFANALSQARQLEPCYDLQECRGKAGEGLQCARGVFRGVSCPGYRLPTEAEWEFLARGGGRPAPHVSLAAAAWFQANSGGQTRPVAMAAPNGLGLRNLFGNVWEWVGDVHSEKYYEWAPPKDPEGPGTGPMQIVRGCGFQSPESECRPGLRRAREPIIVDSDIGFRLVRTLP